MFALLCLFIHFLDEFINSYLCFSQKVLRLLVETHILQQNNKEIDERTGIKIAHKVVSSKNLYHLALNFLEAKRNC